jgi:1,4-dihydroxy-2-naphthoate octaprenyltransferase
MMLGFYVCIVVLVAARVVTPFAALAFLALPRLVQVWRAYTQPRPPEPPRGYPVWPLWYAPLAFIHTRRAGALFLLGLAIGAALGW